jgi:general secretion pathway protein K
MRRRQSGGSFLLVLGVLTSLVAILAAAAATQHTALMAISNRMAARRARLSAEAGIQHALTVLANQDPNTTTVSDEWYATVGQYGETQYTLGGGSFRYQIVDAASLINLNTAPEDQLEKLPLSQEQIDSLLDWREDNANAPRAEGGKDEYYNQLTYPYNARLGALSTLDELLLIKGFTLDTLYEPQDNVVSTTLQLEPKPDGTQPTIYDLATVDSESTTGAQALPAISTVQNAQQFIAQGIPPQVAIQLFNQRAQLTTYRAMLSVPGVDEQVARTLVASYGVSATPTLTGRINVNTASQSVLETIPEVTPDLAQAIVTHQTTGFTQMAELFDMPGFTIEVARSVLDQVAVNSQRFLIRVVGTAGQSNVSLEAVVSISTNGVQVLKVKQLPFPDMSTRWQWDQTPTSDVPLTEAPTP